MLPVKAPGWLFASSLAVFACVPLLGCGASASPEEDPASDEATGTVSLELKVGDTSLDSVDYVITGNGYTKVGTINVAKSRTISAKIGGIPAGQGYEIALSGRGGIGQEISCVGSSSFNVTAHQTTLTFVQLECRLPENSGSVHVVGSANVCPRLDGMSVEPAEVEVGGSIALSATITDSDQSPSPATYAWTATGGTLQGAATASATFTCTQPGSFEITLEVSDTLCSDSASASVTCTPGEDEPQPPAAVRINEVESSGGDPGDWTELHNAGATPADVSGWVFKDNDEGHAYTLPAGTVIPAGGFYIVEEAAQNFGLGSGDSARLFDQAGTLVDTYTWSAHAATSYGRCPDGTGAFQTTTVVTKGAPNNCSPLVKINEVESNQGTPGDWTELYNAGTTAADVSGWIFRDNDDTHSYVVPPATVIPPGGYYVIEEAQQGFGLGAGDSVRLWSSLGTLVDSYTWSAHATTTYGRCPNGSGDFGVTVSGTKGAANDCAPVGPVTFAWPGGNDVSALDDPAQFTSNLSGLTYQAAAGGSPAVLWAVVNGPGTLFRMLFNGTSYVPDSADSWGAGKALRYPDGSGNPDSEGVTLGANLGDGIYVATERNNDASSVSRLSVLRFDASAAGASLSATHEWNLNAVLPAVGANLGLEAITWIPDSFLVGKGFFDEAAGHLYNPAEYANHGSGLFFVGVEASGMVYAFAFDHVSGGVSLIATISTGNPGVMGLEFDRDVGYFWFNCDDTCGNKSGILLIDTVVGSPTRGSFRLARTFEPPTTLPAANNEGIAIAPEAECSGGLKPFFWSDDNDTAGQSLRRDSIFCGSFL